MRFSVLIFAAGFVCAVLVPCGAGTRSTVNAFSKDSSQGNSAQGASPQGNSSPDCITIAEAHKHIGKTNCVTGTVVRVEEGNNGVTYLDFCADYRACPFTVIVFGGDLRKVGDVRQLQGRAVSIKGRIEEYDERAEIILRHAQQLGEGAALLTAIPKEYDVEKQGHYSAGSPSLPKAKKTKRVRQGRAIPLEDPEE
jgi:DNA/RNA endonuclease YhcR with UshA esterase domain